ncbi:MAG: hypothetical protein KAW12_28980 [Candidatus Aminicenantes bacterium]|nr:hypothetical protein [Candidatus Aminicenantes bacterium]
MNTLGQFYKAKIADRSDIILRKMPERAGESKVEKDLFGWKLYSGKNYIECKSGAEARCLKVYFDAGLDEISVPKDQKYLESIIDQLEKIKERIDHIIKIYVAGVPDRKIRERVRREVYEEILK